MSRSIEHHAEFPHPLDAVLVALAGEDALKDRLTEIGGHNAALLSHSASGEAFAYTLRQGIPAEKLPSAMRSLHPGDLMVQREQHWRRENDGKATGTANATVSGIPGSIKARTELLCAGQRTSYRITGEVKVGIPLIGGKIERTIAEQVSRLLHHESVFTTEWLGR